MFGRKSRRALIFDIWQQEKVIEDFKKRLCLQDRNVEVLKEQLIAEEKEVALKQERIVELLDEIDAIHKWIGEWALNLSSSHVIEQLDIDIEHLAMAWNTPNSDWPWETPKTGEKDELSDPS